MAELNIEGWFEKSDDPQFDAYDIWVAVYHPGTKYALGYMHGFMRTDSEMTAYVSRVYLPSEYRGKGIGKRMYKKFIETAFRAGAKVVKSSPLPSEAAQRVWLSLDHESKKVSRIGPAQWQAVRRRVGVRRHRRRA